MIVFKGAKISKNYNTKQSLLQIFFLKTAFLTCLGIKSSNSMRYLHPLLSYIKNKILQ